MLVGVKYMFDLTFRIVEDFEGLLKISSDEFDIEREDFEGLIELNFNGNKIGFMLEDEIIKEMIDCLPCEWIYLWFRNLLETVHKLRTNDYVILSEIECCNWIEFTKYKDCLKVRELKKLRKDIPNFKYIHVPYISTSPLIETVQLKTGETFTRYVEFDETDFKETIIKHEEFESEVLRKSKHLIKEVEKLFPNLSDSKILLKFRNLVKSIEQV